MSANGEAFKTEVSACLRKAGIAALVDCVAKHFPSLEVYSENDDLIIKRARRFLIVRRTGADQFLISQHVAVPSTNQVDAGGGSKRNVGDLFDEISSLSED